MELTLTADCWPNCGDMSIGIVGPAELLIQQPAPVPCEGPGQQQTILVTATGVPNPNPATLDVTATTAAGAQCTTQASVTVHPIDLDVDSNTDGGIDELNGIPNRNDMIEADPFSPKRPGKWGWTNNDDSDGDQQPDHLNAVIDGPADLKDVGDLIVRGIDPAWVPLGAKL